MDVREGIIRRGAAVATSPERKRPLTLLFGGPFDAPVLDRSSQLVALWELPFSRLGGVGDVAWETGGAVVGGAVGVIDGLAHGDVLGAGGVGGRGAWRRHPGARQQRARRHRGHRPRPGLVAPEQARDPERSTPTSARSSWRRAAMHERLWSSAYADPGP